MLFECFYMVCGTEIIKYKIIKYYTPSQILIIEFLGKFFDTARLDWRLWLLSVAIGAVRYATFVF
jgi:hypothetical protein